jgi:hypothetical protein
MCALNIETYLIGFWIFWLHSCLVNQLRYTMHLISRSVNDKKVLLD